MTAESLKVTPPAARLKWRFFWALTNKTFARQLASLALDGYLWETGWTRSTQEGTLVGRDGSPRPWATYSFIEFILPRLRPEWTVFEYGSGSSTLFYAARVARVVTIEHDPAFAAGLRPSLPTNAELREIPLGPSYISAVEVLDEMPSLISVDGRDRVSCVKAAWGKLSPNGVIVLDDTDRLEYEPAWHGLRDRGFKRLDFWGFAPGQAVRRCTTVFYRSENILGL